MERKINIEKSAVENFLGFCKDNSLGIIQGEYILFSTTEELDAAYDLLKGEGYDLSKYNADKSAHPQSPEYFHRISLK